MFKETIAEFLEGSLDAEPEETLGYGRYDHTARTESGTTNRRNDHSRKTLKTSAGKIDVNIPMTETASLNRGSYPKTKPAFQQQLKAR